MDRKEFENWMAVKASSKYKWVEDKISYLNGRGSLYYTGGEDGVYIKISMMEWWKLKLMKVFYPISEKLFLS